MWVAASVSIIFTTVDLKSLLLKTQKVLQSVRSNTKDLSPGWAPQLSICTLRDMLVSSLPLGDLLPLGSTLQPSPGFSIKSLMTGGVMVVGSHGFTPSCEQASISPSTDCVVSSDTGEAHSGTTLS